MTSGTLGGCRSVSQYLDVLGDLQKWGFYAMELAQALERLKEIW